MLSPPYYGITDLSRWAIFVLIPTLLVIYLIFETISKRFRNYPDGPKSSFFVGNMFDVNVPYLHLKLAEWSREYGDFFAFTMASKPAVVISSPEVLTDLLVKKGRKYSSRPLSSPQAALITQNARIINMQYGPQFRVSTCMVTAFSIVADVEVPGTQQSSAGCAWYAQCQDILAHPRIRV